jgi:3-hydroxybutyryl-CoA dehydrogenase
MGPLALMDYVGIDLAYKVIHAFHEAYGERFRPCPLIVQKFKAGHFGRKTGKGFYTYPKKD